MKLQTWWLESRIFGLSGQRAVNFKRSSPLQHLYVTLYQLVSNPTSKNRFLSLRSVALHFFGYTSVPLDCMQRSSMFNIVLLPLITMLSVGLRMRSPLTSHPSVGGWDCLFLEQSFFACSSAGHSCRYVELFVSAPMYSENAAQGMYDNGRVAVFHLHTVGGACSCDFSQLLGVPTHVLLSTYHSE